MSAEGETITVERSIVMACPFFILFVRSLKMTVETPVKRDARTVASNDGVGDGGDAAPWHNLSIADAIERLDTDPTHGLSDAEAAARLAASGPNELREAPRPGFWSRLLDQFKDFLVLILIVASVVSLLLGDYTEAAAIMAIVVLNAILGVVQESRAEEALAALRKMTAPEAQVIRSGHQRAVPARELAPGDLVLLETGNYVPADLRLTEAVNLQIEEASLTGESAPVHKQADLELDPTSPLGDRKNAAYMGTVVTYGRGRGVVVGTGMQTEIGLIAQMLQSFETEPTPLQRKLEQLGRTLGLAALGICGIVFAVGVGRFMLNPTPGVTLLQEILDLFIVAVSLAIAAVPEGLPAVVTICLALGMQRMIQRHALLRRLPAVEALGAATAICSDKTGTLTQNAMSVVQVWADETLLSVTGEGYTPQGEYRDEADVVVEPAKLPGVNLLLRAGLLCNDARLEPAEATDGVGDGATGEGRRAWRMIGDPTEGALVVAAAKAGYWRDEVERDLPRVAEIPFDSDRKRMTTIHRVANPQLRIAKLAALVSGWQPESLSHPQAYLAFVKGAPDVVLDLCAHVYRDGQVAPLSADERRLIDEVNSGLASNALRVLAVAMKPLAEVPAEDALTPNNVERDLIFVGLLGMIDPARPEVKPAIATARRAGIKTVMITGDYPNTAVAIAREIGLLRPQGKVLSGREIDALDDAAFEACVEDVDVYARVSPQHKVRIVEALRDRGHIVAMTGDGVNDAPALKRADIGVAMGITGTDVSKETAAMVLTDDNYASIVSAVEEGRTIYANIRKFVYYLLSCNVGEILVIFVATLLGWPLPLTAIQLLVLNLLTDGAPALALGLERPEPDVMARPPRRPDEPIINRQMTWGIAMQATAKAVAVLGVFQLALWWFPGNEAHARTMAFATLSIAELLRAYSARSEYFTLWQMGLLGNKYMHLAVAASVAILLAIIYVPALDPVFGTTFLTWRDWLVMLPLGSLAAVVTEIGKVVQQRREFEKQRG
jgi:Ca2+-transporting ATPase